MIAMKKETAMRKRPMVASGSVMVEVMDVPCGAAHGPSTSISHWKKI